MCGDSTDNSNANGFPQSWAAYGVIAQSTDVFTYNKDYLFDYGTGKYGYCGGVFTDSKNMYVLIITDKLTAGK